MCVLYFPLAKHQRLVLLSTNVLIHLIRARADDGFQASAICSISLVWAFSPFLHPLVLLNTYLFSIYSQQSKIMNAIKKNSACLFSYHSTVILPNMLHRPIICYISFIIINFRNRMGHDAMHALKWFSARLLGVYTSRPMVNW